MPITVIGPWPPGEPESDAFEAELSGFIADQRVKVLYEQYHGIDHLVDRVMGPEPPEVIVSPQPATLLALAPRLIDLAEFENPVALRRDFGDFLMGLATLDGAILGAPIKLDLKSLVWYRPADFAAAGYEVPATFDELVALCDRMVADGRTPFSNYIGSGFATGWVGTDWIEDLLLGAAGPAVYDQWVAHDIPFADPRVEAAFARYLQMIDTAGYVFDRPAMLTRMFWESVFPLVAGDVLMHKQATFLRFGIEMAGGDPAEFATFKFPSVDPAFGNGVTGGGAYMAATTDMSEVRQLTRFMLSQRFGREALAATGGWLLPNVRFDTKRYPDALVRGWGETARDAIAAGQFRFDGSDVMPAPVGTGSFWAGIVDLVSGAKTVPEALADIDASWPM